MMSFCDAVEVVTESVEEECLMLSVFIVEVEVLVEVVVVVVVVYCPWSLVCCLFAAWIEDCRSCNCNDGDMSIMVVVLCLPVNDDGVVYLLSFDVDSELGISIVAGADGWMALVAFWPITTATPCKMRQFNMYNLFNRKIVGLSIELVKSEKS